MRPAFLSDRHGFTLVEGIVAGALSLFTIVTAMALYKMNADQIRGSFIRSMTRMQYQTLIEQIESDARQAKVVLTTSGATTFDTDTAAKTSDAIYFFDGSGNTLGGYRRVGTILREPDSIFRVGGRTVRVVDVGTNNTFSIAGDKKSVTLNLSVFGVDGSLRDTVTSKRETFVCRN